MRRGEIWLVNLDPILGSEAAKTRPAVIVSASALNDVVTGLGRGVLTVVPVTSNVTRVYPFQALLRPGRGLTAESKAQAEQVRAVDVRRFVRRLGQISSGESVALDEALRLHLDL